MATILIVDDSEEMRFLLQVIVETKDTVFLASSGQEAMKILEEKSVDLVISDFEMPNGNGSWLLKESRKLFSPPSIIILSASFSITEKQMLDQGALAFFQKPFSPKALRHFISEFKEKKK